MTWLAFELRLVMRSRLIISMLLLLLGLSLVSVTNGLYKIAQQEHTIARLIPLQEQDAAAVAARYPDNIGGGRPAFYTFYGTWDQPSNAAFLAIGLRDLAPYALRIRALGLQAQLYEGEIFNPEIALAGPFDFAFVLIYLAPLFIIVFLHDLVSSERQAGRLPLLRAMPTGSRLWARRVVLRYLLVFGCLITPALIGAAISATSLMAIGVLLIVVASYLAFWTGISLVIATRDWHSVTHATALVGAWVVLTLVLPTLANVLLTRTIPVHQGVDLMLAQRDAVHGAWEIPREATMQKFFISHPEWKDTAALPAVFHWKWYFAFHQVGDESVADQVDAYRTGLLARQAWTHRLGWVLPGVGTQAILHRAADTDLLAQLAYHDQIAAFHEEMRRFYYPYLFNDLMFGAEDFANRPVFTPRTPHPFSLGFEVFALLALSWLMLVWGLHRLRRV